MWGDFTPVGGGGGRRCGSWHAMDWGLAVARVPPLEVSPATVAAEPIVSGPSVPRLIQRVLPSVRDPLSRLQPAIAPTRSTVPSFLSASPDHGYRAAAVAPPPASTAPPSVRRASTERGQRPSTSTPPRSGTTSTRARSSTSQPAPPSTTPPAPPSTSPQAPPSTPPRAPPPTSPLARPSISPPVPP